MDTGSDATQDSYEAIAIASFEAQDPAELSIHENELIVVFTAPAPEGWCLALKQGAEGLVPKNYVERLRNGRIVDTFVAEDDTELSCVINEVVQVLPRPAPEGWLFVKRGPDIGLVPFDYVDESAVSMREILSSAQPALVIADFTPEDAAELAVRAGEIVLVLGQPNAGWSTCTRLLDPETPPGLVPSEYLKAPYGEMLADFKAEEDGEVSAKLGERVWMNVEQPDGAVSRSLKADTMMR